MAGLLSATFILAVATPAANAGPLTGSFSGTVTSVPTELSTQFSVGDTISGSYTFESTTTARAGSNSSLAVFDALTTVTYNVGSYTATSVATQEIQVDNDVAGNDRYGVTSRSVDGLMGADVNSLPLIGASFRLDDSTATVFSDALILPTSIDFSDFDSNGFFLFFGSFQADLFIVEGSLDSLQITNATVPEPSSFVLGAIGGLGLVGLGWRKRRRLPSAD